MCVFVCLCVCVHIHVHVCECGYTYDTYHVFGGQRTASVLTFYVSYLRPDLFIVILLHMPGCLAHELLDSPVFISHLAVQALEL